MAKESAPSLVFIALTNKGAWALPVYSLQSTSTHGHEEKDATGPRPAASKKKPKSVEPPVYA